MKASIELSIISAGTHDLTREENRINFDDGTDAVDRCGLV
jgi:hypothetical protein